MSGGDLEALRPQIEAAALELIPKRGVSSGCSAKWTPQVSCYAKDFDATKMVEAIAEWINGKPNARFLQVEIPKDAEAIRIEVPGAQLVAIRQWEASIPEGVRIEDNERITILALMTDEEAQG